jgi:hypothetical protein
VWEADTGPTSYPQWSPTQKADLRTAFLKAWDGTSSGLTDPPPLTLQPADNGFPGRSVSAGDAFALFSALAANSLAVEIDKRVPWSMQAYDDAALARLIDARTLFVRAPRPNEYLLGSDNPIGELGVPAPPEVALAFLRQAGILSGDRRSTIIKLCEWCRDQLWHFSGSLNSAKNYEDHWQFRGKPPASRVIAGTAYTGKNQPTWLGKRRHYTAGCWGTTAFLAEILRTVNIPVQEMIISNYEAYAKRPVKHAAPCFMSEGWYMSHADDLYDRAVQIQPSYPVDKLFIDKATFDKWFPAGAEPTATSAVNLSRRVAEADLQFLPIYILDLHAQDLQAGRPHDGTSEVAKGFVPYFTLAELETARLWPRLDARVAELGGAEKVRAIYRAGLATYDRQSLVGQQN